MSVIALLFLSVAAPRCGPGDAADASGEDAGAVCSSALDCDDGSFCSGAERCAPGDPDADARGCIAAARPACAAPETCDEALDRCVADCGEPDADRDGHRSAACGGSDCDDADARRAPGNAEVCEPEDVDEDCDAATFGIRDGDADGESDARCCNTSDEGARACGTDCDDTRAGVSPRVAETCDGLDNDCDGAIDELVVRTFYVDADGDGDGDSGAPTTTGCTLPAGHSESGGDCDDGDSNVGPGATELCDGVDQNCSTGGGPDTTEDADGDGFTAPGHECTGGFAETDCDDTSASIHPDAPELCASPADDDCDGDVDEASAADAVDWYADTDRDGYGAGAATRGCTGPTPTHVDRAGDCDPTDALVHPGAALQSAPYCVGSCSHACGSGSSWVCASSRSDCLMICSMGAPPDWDYDCNGAIETQHLPPGHSFARCTRGVGCTGPSVWAEEPVCGAMQTVRECGFIAGTLCGYVDSADEAVRCR